MSLSKSKLNRRILKGTDMKKYSKELIPSDDDILLIF